VKKLKLMLMVGMIAAIQMALAEDQTGKAQIKAVTDKPDAIYRKGEKIKFNVLLSEDNKPIEGKTVKYTITRDKEKTQKGTVVSKTEPVAIETELKEPGFVLCWVSCEYKTGENITGVAGAAVDPLNIKASRPAPEDFDKFWQERREELAKVPLKSSLEPVEVPDNLKDKVECFDVKIDCAGGMPVSGYFAKPGKAAQGSLPAIVFYHAAGVRSSSKPFGYAARGMLALDINAHGIENGKPENFYKELAEGKLKGYPFFNSDDSDKIYFKGMFLRLIRSLDFIKSRPEWDGKTLIVSGSSQGGGQALVAAGLDPRVTLCIAHVPALCDHTGILADQSSGWPRFIKLKDGKPENENIVRTVPYFDAANFASKIKADTLITVGFIDTTCAPSSVYAAYNNIKGSKQIINMPLCGHGISKEGLDAAGTKINEHLQKMKSGKQ